MASINPPIKSKDLETGSFYFIRSKVDFTSPPGEDGPLQFVKKSIKKEYRGGSWNDRYEETNWQTSDNPSKKLTLIQNNWYYFKFSNGKDGYFTYPTVEDIRPEKLRIEEFEPVYNLEQYSLYYVRRKSDFESPVYPDDRGFAKLLQFLGVSPQDESVFIFEQAEENEFRKRTIGVKKDMCYYFSPSAQLDKIPSHANLNGLLYRKRTRTYKSKNKRSKSRRN
jgi:hypothetical protein